MSFYLGGSRSVGHPVIPAFVSAVVASGAVVRVGCQFGADAAVVASCPPLALSVFAVAPAAHLPAHVARALSAGARVVPLAGGLGSVKSRYFLRSLRGLSRASVAVFFCPGFGSLAVAGVAVSRGLPVFAFSPVAPASPRGCVGSWVAGSLLGFSCLQWSAGVTQPALF